MTLQSPLENLANLSFPFPCLYFFAILTACVASQVLGKCSMSLQSPQENLAKLSPFFSFFFFSFFSSSYFALLGRHGWCLLTATRAPLSLPR